jgi:hypothetical protein
MKEHAIDKVGFNRRLDELVENVLRQDDISSEFTREYVKATNLCRRVAEYDVQLAQELFFSTVMFAYYFAIGVTKKAFK